MTRLAVVGSRNFDNPRMLNVCLRRWIVENGPVTEIVSGGAAGADREAEKWAMRNDIPLKVYSADWERFGRSAGILRNHDIVDRADAMIAFPSNEGSGTQNSIQLAEKKGIPVRSYWAWK